MTFRILFCGLLCFTLFACQSNTENNEEQSSDETGENTTVETPTNDDSAIDKSLMQGKWVSAEDEKSFFTLTDDKLTMGYDGVEMTDGVITWVKSCEDSAADADSKYFSVVEGGTNTMCYYLVSVSKDKLEYSNAARGNTLSFVRAK